MYCALGKKALVQEDALFITCAPSGVLVLDLNKELPGRHICLECKSSVIEAAFEQGLFRQFFGESVIIPENFVDVVLATLQKKAVGLLCIAKKAGILTFGFEKIRAALLKSEVEFVLHAIDGKPGGKQKTGLNAGAAKVFSVFTSAQLGKVVGRKRVVHMAILKGNVSLSRMLVENITKIGGFL